MAGGLGGQGNGEGTGDAARFNNDRDAVFGGDGNLYIGEYRRIRKVELATAKVTTLTGSPDTSGCIDGIGADARWQSPGGMAPDGKGNLYVVDITCHTIRKVVLATGAVTTIAGEPGMTGSADGVGAAARFNNPFGAALDLGGNLYVTDASNRTIRKLVLATGAVTTIAGAPGVSACVDGIGAAARLQSPLGAVFDGTGKLYFTDCHSVRQLDVATGAVTLFAGGASKIGSADGVGAAARFTDPAGLTLDGAGSLYIADSYNHTIRKAEVATGAVTTWAGSPASAAGSEGTRGSTDALGTAARFYLPRGVASDRAGSVYVADAYNNAVRKVTAAGAVTTLAGSAEKTGSSDGIGAAARFQYPRGAAVDGAGNLYVADTNNQVIRKVVVATGAVTTLAGSPGMLGNVDGRGAAARFGSPSGMASDDSGMLYVADPSYHAIRKIVVATGEVTTLAIRPNLSGPAGVALDRAGNLYVANLSAHTILKVVVATGAATTLAGSAGMSGSTDGTGAAARFNRPDGVAVDAAGNLYVADSANQTIRRVEVDTGKVTTLAGAAGLAGSADGTAADARFRSPTSLALDRAGNLYVADGNNNSVRKIQVGTGVVTTVVGIAGQTGVQPGLLPARLNLPRAVAVSSVGELFILDENSVLLAH